MPHQARISALPTAPRVNIAAFRQPGVSPLGEAIKGGLSGFLAGREDVAKREESKQLKDLRALQIKSADVNLKEAEQKLKLEREKLKINKELETFREEFGSEGLEDLGGIPATGEAGPLTPAQTGLGELSAGAQSRLLSEDLREGLAKGLSPDEAIKESVNLSSVRATEQLKRELEVEAAATQTPEEQEKTLLSKARRRNLDANTAVAIEKAKLSVSKQGLTQIGGEDSNLFQDKNGKSILRLDSTDEEGNITETFVPATSDAVKILLEEKGFDLGKSTEKLAKFSVPAAFPGLPAKEVSVIVKTDKDGNITSIRRADIGGKVPAEKDIFNLDPDTPEASVIEKIVEDLDNAEDAVKKTEGETPTEPTKGTKPSLDVTKFENQFIPGVNRIEDYDKIILKDESSGIFNLILHHYKTLLKNNGFRYKQSIAKVRETIKRESDKLAEFVEVCLIRDPNSFLINDEMFHTYTKFTHSKNYETFTKRKFGSRFPTYGFMNDSKYIDGKTTRVWLGVKLNEEWSKNNKIIT